MFLRDDKSLETGKCHGDWSGPCKLCIKNEGLDKLKHLGYKVVLDKEGFIILQKKD